MRRTGRSDQLYVARMMLVVTVEHCCTMSPLATDVKGETRLPSCVSWSPRKDHPLTLTQSANSARALKGAHMVQIFPYQGAISRGKDIPGYTRRHIAVSCAKMAHRDADWVEDSDGLIYTYIHA